MGYFICQFSPDVKGQYHFDQTIPISLARVSRPYPLAILRVLDYILDGPPDRRFSMNKEIKMKYLSAPIWMIASLLVFGGCVSEKAFDEVIQQLEDERTKTEVLRKEIELTKKESAQLSSDLDELRENSGSTSQTTAAQNRRVKQLRAKIARQGETIKSLEEKAKTPKAQKAKMKWAIAVARTIKASFKNEIRNDQIQVDLTEAYLKVTLPELIVFEPDGVDITLNGEEILARLAEAIRQVKNHEMVVGAHLDDTPIAKVMAPDFPTAWDFTGARAIEVVRFLEEEGKISGKVLSATAYGSARPVARNSNEAGRDRNRRIEITLLP